jgi:gamma-glutamyl:cysteine ligase YbdK (ATP-grasp superfamily)
MVTTNNALEVLMGREYEDDAREAFSDSSLRANFVPTVGFETEYSVVKAGETELVGQQVRDGIIAQDSELAGQELGEWQLEVRGKPVNLADGGFQALEAHVKEREGRAARAARQLDAELVRIGAFPLQPLDKINRSRTRRYEQVVTWHNEHHSPTVPTYIGASGMTRSATAEIMALMNSVQFNLATPSAAEAIKWLNISFSLIPQIVAVGGNSRFLDGVDTHYSDTRMLMWERTHDTRTPIEIITNAPLRVGLPSKYFRDSDDYNNFVRNHKFIIYKPGHALKVGTGLTWLDARLKPQEDKILLEFRPVSVQPSVEEDVAVCAFYLGLLAYHRAQERPLPPLTVVRNNRFLAMRYGLRAVFTEFDGETPHQVPARRVIEEELKNAAAGLVASGFEGGVERLEILRARLRHMRGPSDEFAARVERMKSEGALFEDALRRGVRACVVTEAQ